MKDSLEIFDIKLNRVKRTTDRGDGKPMTIPVNVTDKTLEQVICKILIPYTHHGCPGCDKKKLCNDLVEAIRDTFGDPAELKAIINNADNMLVLEADRAGITPMGSDTPEHMADIILELTATLTRLKKQVAEWEATDELEPILDKILTQGERLNYTLEIECLKQQVEELQQDRDIQEKVFFEMEVHYRNLIKKNIKLKAKVERLKTQSAVETMCDNESVRQHITEWEVRCLKAEADLDRAIKVLKKIGDSDNWFHTTGEPGGPYTAWRGKKEPDEIAIKLLTKFGVTI